MIAGGASRENEVDDTSDLHDSAAENGYDDDMDGYELASTHYEHFGLLSLA